MLNYLFTEPNSFDNSAEKHERGPLLRQHQCSMSSIDNKNKIKAKCYS